MKLRVYLVEDSPIMSNLLLELVQVGATVVVGRSDNAPEAIAGIRTLRPDVVILDIALRAGTGFDVLNAFWDQPPRKRPVWMMLTNYGLEAYRQQAAELRVDFFFDKSTQIHRMLSALHAIAKSTTGAIGSAK